MAQPEVPAWSSRREACVLILRGVTFTTCGRIALVVGTILSIVNQGAMMIDGDTTVMTSVRVGFNYLVPFRQPR